MQTENPAGEGANFQPENEAGSADNGSMGAKKLPTLIDNIDAISHAILEGTKEEKESFAQKHFFVSGTSELLKKYGMTGDFITIKYGVIARHFGKDPDHNLTAKHWKELAREIIRPFAISKYNDGFRLFTNVKIGEKWVATGIDVKNPGRNIEINNIATAFGYNFNDGRKEEILYVSEKATPEQVAVLNRLNSGQYLPAHEANGLSSLSSTGAEKSSAPPLPT